MSKMTTAQRAILDKIRQQIDHWETSNDLHSPTHGADIQEEFNALMLDDLVTDDQADTIADPLLKLWEAFAELNPRSLGVPGAEPPVGLSAVSPAKPPEDAASIPHAGETVLTDKEIHDITYKQYPVNCVIDDDRPEHPFDLNYDKRRALADKLRAARTVAEFHLKQFERGIQEGDTVLVGKPIDAPEHFMAQAHGHRICIPVRDFNEFGELTFCDHMTELPVARKILERLQAAIRTVEDQSAVPPPPAPTPGRIIHEGKAPRKP